MQNIIKRFSVAAAMLVACGAIWGDDSVTLTCGSPTATTVPLSWTSTVEDENISNITLSIDEGAPIILTKIGSDWPDDYTVTGLTKGREHTFSINLYVNGGTDPLTDQCTATTLNTSGCTFTSQVKETKDKTWKDGCDFTADYIVAINTTSSSPLTLSVTYTKPSNISPSKVELGIKRRSSEEDLTVVGDMADNGAGTYSLNITSENLSGIGVTTAGDSILVAVKNTVAGCANNGMYCTKFLGYALGIGCNEPYVFSFTKRTSDQKIFSINTNADIIRFGVKPSGSLTYTYYTLDSDSHTYTLNISDYMAGSSYDFVLFDKYGRTSGIKAIYTVY